MRDSHGATENTKKKEKQVPGETGRTKTRGHRQSVPADPGPLRPGTRPSDYAPQGPQAPQSSPGYYDVPMLKAPVWKWEIASYFFLGGVAGGAFLLARMAERFGGREYRELTRVGSF